MIYADPPWTYKDKANDGNRGNIHKYNVMSLPDICNLPVNNIAAENCFLAMWWVGPQPREALAVIDAWGFKLNNMTGFTWHKETKHGKSAFGMGHWTRGNAENCLFATKGKIKRVNAGVRQFISAPIREHSRKPDEARDRLVQLIGDVDRIELFARGKYKGWDTWGDGK